MELATHAVLLLLLAAFVAGWVDAVVGGGGLIQLPSLLIGLPDDTSAAAISGTNKVSSAAGTLVATITYLRRIPLDVRAASPLVVAAFAGSMLGARLVQYLPKQWFTPVVLVVLVAVGIHTLRRPSLGLQHNVRHHGAAHALRAGAIGAVVGVYDGFLGPGTGSFFVIALVGLLGYGFLQASAMAKLANLTTNAAAILVLGSQGVVIWHLALPMAAANLTGGFLGARTALRRGNGFIRKVFITVVSALAAKLAWDTVVLFS
ncbi:sulfite exporter TauE/SafE family protein [Aestuariimicrobium ganziense]|uniref:sulfite exporter TauE/SafE family protein n=1 Tax=Aestuariimicrobium ganziense TaxID=2773677 RepID=UPI001943D53B|nr:TSUP family transporter [Aestuariimicrobium ganziense]